MFLGVKVKWNYDYIVLLFKIFDYIPLISAFNKDCFQIHNTAILKIDAL